jgi:hypothetical protein
MLNVFCLLALFGIKHFIADFVMQYEYMVRDKGIYGAAGGIHHAAFHATLTLWILVFIVGNANVAIVLALLDGVIHYHIDWAKQKYTKGLTPADRKFWIWLGLDQCLHYLTYVAIIAYIVM